MPRLKDRTNLQYGQLTVHARADNDKHGNAQWTCTCLCGALVIVNGMCLQQGHTKSCGCRKSHLRPFESLYHRLQSMAAHPVTLTYGEFLTMTTITSCHYCGKAIVWRPHYAGKGGWQLDRKDPLRGYDVGNVVVCCKRCNMGKGNSFTYDEWVQIGALIRSWHKVSRQK